MTGERIDQNSQLFDIQATSPEIVKPKPPSFTSIPSLLISLQNEWDALMLETFTLKKQFHQTRKELSNSLYENDAAKRVIARLIKERDEARVQLSNFKGSAPVAAASATAASAHPVQDSNAMDTDAAPLPASVVEKIDVISEEYSILALSVYTNPTLDYHLPEEREKLPSRLQLQTKSLNTR